MFMKAYEVLTNQEDKEYVLVKSNFNIEQTVQLLSILKVYSTAIRSLDLKTQKFSESDFNYIFVKNE